MASDASAPDRASVLRFAGGRYEPGGYPVDLLVELKRFEALLVEVARDLWLTDHPGRARVPAGFVDAMRLRLTEVRAGCVEALIERPVPSSTARLFDAPDHHDRARGAVVEAFAALENDGTLPSAFPEGAVLALGQFGSSFAEDESCTVVTSDGPDVRYTQVGRHRLLGLRDLGPARVERAVVGRVAELNADLQTFEVALRDGAKVPGRYDDPALHAQLRRVLGKHVDAPTVRLTGEFLVDRHDTVVRVAELEHVETIVSDEDPSGARLAELLRLDDGWLDGDGIAPTVASIEAMRDTCAELASAGQAAVPLFPTPEGGVLAEVFRVAAHWSVEAAPDGALELDVLDGSTESNIAAAPIADIVASLEAFRAV